jgi:hypothetical protein
MGGIGQNKQPLNDMWKVEIIHDDDEELIAKWTQVQITNDVVPNATIISSNDYNK